MDGYSFRFKDGDNIIEPWFSSFTGLEKVTVNNKLVVKQRNLSTNSSTTFKIQNNSYKTNLNIESILKGPFVCSLYKNDELFKQQKLVFDSSNKNTPWYRKIWFNISLGLFVGLTSSYFKFSLWWALIPLVPLLIFNLVQSSNGMAYFEEIDLEKDIN